MSFVAVAVGGGALIGGIAGAVISSNATGNAANTQATSAQNAENLQLQEFNQQQSNEAPYLAAGASSLPQLKSMASAAPSFTAADFQEDPGYQFDLQQGQQAIQRSAAASGGLQSGGTLKALAQYTQGQASNEYGNAYNRYMNNQSTQFNRLASLSGIGQTGNAQTNQAGQNYANNTANEVTGLGNAQAGAQTAQGQIWGNTLSSLGTGVPSSIMQYGQMSNMNNWMNNMNTNNNIANNAASGYQNGYSGSGEYQMSPGMQTSLSNIGAL